MEAMTHTPGPWNFNGKPAKPIWAHVLVGKDGFEVDQTEEANARLIAAAPALLQMLEGIAEGIVQAREPTWSAAQKQAFLNGLADAARAAIAQAKGEVK
jgi:hypothetical protein